MRVCSGLRALIYLILHTLAPILTSRIPLRRNRPHSEGVWEPAAPPGHVRPQERGRVRQNPRFLRDSMGIRAPDVSAPVERSGPDSREFQPRLLPAGSRPVHRADDAQAEPRHEKEPQGPPPTRAIPMD